MPTYEIKAPNGKTYRIDGPDGATDDQVRQEVLRQFPEASGGDAAPQSQPVTTNPRYADLAQDPLANAAATNADPVESRIAALDQMVRSGANADAITARAQELGIGVNPDQLKSVVGFAAQPGGKEYYQTRNLSAFANPTPPPEAAPQQPTAPVDQSVTGALGNSAMNAMANVGQGFWGGIEGLVNLPGQLVGNPNQGNTNSVGDYYAQVRPQAADAPTAGLAQFIGGAMIPMPGTKVLGSAEKVAANTTRASQDLTRLEARNALAGPVAAPPVKNALAREIIDTGKQEGVRVLTTDVVPPKTFIGKSVRAVGERIPVIGTGGVRSAQNEERIAAVKRLVDEYGAGSDVGTAVDAVAADLAKTRGDQLKKLTAQKNSVIEGLSKGLDGPEKAALEMASSFGGGAADGPGVKVVEELEKRGLVKITSYSPVTGSQYYSLTDAGKTALESGTINRVPTPLASKAIDEQIQRLSGINAEAFAPVIAKLKSFEAQLESGKTLSQIEGNRKLLGDLFADPSLASIKGDGQKALNAIYGPLREDMAAFIGQTGGKGQLARWKNANDQLAAMAGELDAKAFKNVLNSADTTPEAAAKLIFGKTPSDMRRLYANLSETGKAKAQSAIILKAAEGATENGIVSPDKFKRAIDAMDKATGVFFPPAEKARLDGLHRLLSATQRAADASVMTNSGQQAVPFLMGGAALTFPKIAGSVALIARAYESAAVRNLLVGLSRTKPGSQAERSILERIQKVKLPPAVGVSAAQHMPPLNDNITAPLAAQDNNQQQRQQQPAP